MSRHKEPLDLFALPNKIYRRTPSATLGENRTVLQNVKVMRRIRPKKGISIKTILKDSNARVVFERIQAGSEFPRHSHLDATDVFYVVQGSGKILLSEKKLSAGSGDYIVVPPGIEHGVVNDSEHDLTLLLVQVHQDQ